MERARAFRGLETDSLTSYEGLLRERLYLGVDAPGFRRERALYDAERVARVRWDREVGRTIQWIGAREAAPLLGERGRLSWRKDRGQEGGGSITLGFSDPPDGETSPDPERILRSLNPLVFEYRPGDDHLAFGDRFMLHPLADTAGRHYRYRSGDTVTIALPGADDITLIEILVEPRRSAFELIAGSLWFHAEFGALVRAHYRPSRPFDLELDDGDDVPGPFSPFRIGIDYLTVEYSHHEGRWWMPRRFAVRGQVDIGRMFELPMALEWSVSGYELNSASSRIPVDPPAGWTEGFEEHEADDGTIERVRVLVPPIDSLRGSPELTGETLGPSSVTFSDRELSRIRDQLRELTPRRPLWESGLAYGLSDGNLRYNRVEGLGVGVSAELGLAPGIVLEPRARLGLADRALRGSLGLVGERDESRAWLSAYRRLAHTDDFGDPHSLGRSLSNFVLRNATAQFYDATGGELGLARSGRRTHLGLRLFAEEHRAVERETNFDLWEPLVDDTLPSVIAAVEGGIVGVAGSLRWQLGDDPVRGVLDGSLRGEATAGDFDYRRILGTVAARRALVRGLSVGVEVAAGGLWGTAPVQRHFYLGGESTLRGYAGSFAHGESFWMARVEVATRTPVAKVALFSDWGWAGPRERWGRNRALQSAGVGLSFLDGLFRIDAAWPLRDATGGHVYLYLDGIF